MKRHLLTLLALFTFVISSNAQFRKGSHEKIKTLKIAYLTEQLDLTPAEAQKFWPVYNKHQEKLIAFRKEITKGIKEKIKNFDTLKEAEAKKLIEIKLKVDKKQLLENEAFTRKLSTFLPYKKILKLQISEREFGRKLMRKYRKKGQRNRN